MRKVLVGAVVCVTALVGLYEPASAHRTPKVHKHGNGHGWLHTHVGLNNQPKPAAFMQWWDGVNDNTSPRWVLRVNCDNPDVYCDDEGA